VPDQRQQRLRLVRLEHTGRIQSGRRERQVGLELPRALADRDQRLAAAGSADFGEDGWIEFVRGGDGNWQRGDRA
jgi:hypothetical protein